jgi:hypothetical protein
MTTAVLRDPKLREYIAAFLHDSYADLKSWALLSTSFTPSAQKHQFHHITLTKRPRCFAACYRLCAVLIQSPHLVPLVHNLDAIVDTVVLMQLSGLHFLNLQELFLQGDLSLAVEENPIASASVLIALPRLRSLRLKDVIFSDMSGLARLFGSASPQLESLSLQYVHFESATTCEYDDAHVIPRRPHIKSIHLANPARQMIDWFLRPHCPLDFSQLHDTDIVVSEMTADNVQLLEGVRLSLQRLTFQAIPRAPLGAGACIRQKGRYTLNTFPQTHSPRHWTLGASPRSKFSSSMRRTECSRAYSRYCGLSRQIMISTL